VLASFRVLAGLQAYRVVLWVMPGFSDLAWLRGELRS
jgi:hypothetical protein